MSPRNVRSPRSIPAAVSSYPRDPAADPHIILRATLLTVLLTCEVGGPSASRLADLDEVLVAYFARCPPAAKA
jgi:hypothetical protein